MDLAHVTLRSGLLRERSPLATAVVTSAMLRTWPVRFPATAFQEDMEALKHNFLVSGFFKRRGYEDSTELARHRIARLPAGPALADYPFDDSKLFGGPDSTKLHDQKSLNKAGKFLENNPFGLVVVIASEGPIGDSDKDRTLSEAGAMVVSDYLVEHFRLDDKRIIIRHCHWVRPKGRATAQKWKSSLIPPCCGRKRYITGVDIQVHFSKIRIMATAREEFPVNPTEFRFRPRYEPKVRVWYGAAPRECYCGSLRVLSEKTMTARNLCLLGLLSVPLAAQQLEPPALPAAAKAIEVAPNADVKLKFHFLAVGKQIYRCDNGAWAQGSTPAANLYDMNSNLKVRHTAGPTWSMVDGGGTIKGIGATAAHFASLDGVSIDWVKLDADKASRTGAFSDVGIIQRLYTGGGKAPTTGCTANQVQESAYTAHYYFWISK